MFVDDTVPLAAGGTNGHVYTTYFIKAGAIRFGYSPPKNAKCSVRHLLVTVAGADQLFQHDNFAFHVTDMSGSVVDRARYKYLDYDSFAAATFVAVAPFDCDPGRLLPSDLLTMGDVAKFEAEFNDKGMSPKYSLTIGRSDTSDLAPPPNER